VTAPVASTGPLVLLVDDYADSREMYAEFLEISGFRVIQARDAEEALVQAAERLPDVVLMDFSLPGVDGGEATRRLKASPRTAAIPVVILSGLPSEYAERAGADAFISKPCAPETLVAEIHRLVDAAH
jgi:two-component system, cell cycle response regulator DivK